MISEAILTKSRLDIVLHELETLSPKLYSKNFNLQAILNTEYDVEFKDLILSHLREDLPSYATSDAITLDNSLKTLKKSLEELKIINIQLAFVPREGLLEKILDWVNRNVGEGIVLNIQTDKNILGGIVISFRGKYLDLSLATALKGYKYDI